MSAAVFVGESADGVAVGIRRVIRFDAVQQVARVGEFFVDRFETLAQCQFAAFEQGEQVGGGDDIERELLAAAGAWSRWERLYRSVALSESVSRCLGLSSSTRWPVCGVGRAGVERVDFFERWLTAAVAGRVGARRLGRRRPGIRTRRGRGRSRL